MSGGTCKVDVKPKVNPSSIYTFDITDGTNTTTVNDTDVVKFKQEGDILAVEVNASKEVIYKLNEQRDDFNVVALSLTDTVTLTKTPTAGGVIKVYRNGDLQELGTDYTISGLDIMFVIPFGQSGGGTVGEIISVIYFYN